MSEPIKVLFEDNHLLVIDKPALLATMGVSEGEDSLVQRAKNYLRVKYNKPGNVYVGVVSRLDSFVSGVIVMARTSKSASRLTDQFRRRIVQKSYLAIIPDSEDFLPEGQLDHRMIKNESMHRMVVVPDGAGHREGEKRASLSYRTLGISGNQRLLEVHLETGRKHQIRVQFSAIGLPIVGDQKYDSRTNFKTGIALHSHRLKFEHPTLKTSQSFESHPPTYWRIERFGYD